MLTTREHDGNFIIDFSVLEDWDSFEVIASKLQGYFNATMQEKIQGPDGKIWFIKMEGHEFSLHNNPYGNYLMAKSEEAQAKLKELFPKLQEMLE